MKIRNTLGATLVAVALLVMVAVVGAVGPQAHAVGVDDGQSTAGSTTNQSAGDLSAGDVSTGDLSIGEQSTGDLSTGDLSTFTLSEPYQGVSATGQLTYGQGTCFPDAVLVDCSGNVTRQLKGPGGAGFFAPYIGQWVDVNGAEQECQPGQNYIDVVTIQPVADQCGTPTATPPGPTATPVNTVVPPPPGQTPTPPPGGGNLALGKQLFASTTQGGQVPGQAADGDLTTVWASAPGSHPYYRAQNQQWIYVDLGAEYSVERMRMQWNHNQWRHARGYAVYAWLDYCGGWCLLASTRYGDGDDELVLRYGAVTSPYFMLWLVNPGLMGGHYELAEWTIGGETRIQTTNVAAGKAALALNHQPGFEAARAIDADDGTDWRSTGTPTWIYVNLGSAYDIDRAGIKWTAGMHAPNYAFYAWAGTSWAPLINRTGVTGADETFGLPNVRTQYVLLYAPEGTAPGAPVGVREFALYEAAGGGTTPPGGPPPYPLGDGDALLSDGIWGEATESMPQSLDSALMTVPHPGLGLQRAPGLSPRGFDALGDTDLTDLGLPPAR